MTALDQTMHSVNTCRTSRRHISAETIIQAAVWAMLLVGAAYIAADIYGYTRGLDQIALGMGGY